MGRVDLIPAAVGEPLSPHRPPGPQEDIDRLYAESKQNPGSDGAKEFNEAMKSLAALRDGREGEYEGKQLGYGPSSHDLRDAAELKVPVVEEFKPNGYPMGSSHRLVYREFDLLPRVEGDRVVQDPNALPYRQAVAFEHRANDPAAVAYGRAHAAHQDRRGLRPTIRSAAAPAAFDGGLYTGATTARPRA